MISNVNFYISCSKCLYSFQGSSWPHCLLIPMGWGLEQPLVYCHTFSFSSGDISSDLKYCWNTLQHFEAWDIDGTFYQIQETLYCHAPGNSKRLSKSVSLQFPLLAAVQTDQHWTHSEKSRTLLLVLLHHRLPGYNFYKFILNTQVTSFKICFHFRQISQPVAPFSIQHWWGVATGQPTPFSKL